MWECGPQTYLPLQTPGRKAGLPHLWARRCAWPVADISPGGWSCRAASSPAGWLNTDCEIQRQETETEGKRSRHDSKITRNAKCLVCLGEVTGYLIPIWFDFIMGVFQEFIWQSALFPKTFLQILDYGLFFLCSCTYLPLSMSIFSHFHFSLNLSWKIYI